MLDESDAMNDENRPFSGTDIDARVNVLAKGRKRSLSSAFQSGSCTAWELIFERAHQTPEAVAIAAPGRNPLCFGNLESHISAVGVALNAMGVGRNDRVALVLPNGPEMAVAFLAVTSCATCAPLNVACTASEFEFYLDDLQARGCLIYC